MVKSSKLFLIQVSPQNIHYIYRGDVAISEFFEAILEKELRNRRSWQLRVFFIKNRGIYSFTGDIYCRDFPAGSISTIEGIPMEYTHKPVDELSFTDDFMFGTVMKIKYKNLRPAGAVPQAATGASVSERGGRA